MCGLFGAVIYGGAEAREALIRRVAIAEKTQSHRGPDMSDLTEYHIGDAFVVLAHQRLSILDLSENGRQPMTSHNGKQHIVFNGEIYNYKEIAAAQGYASLTSSSDTEVILERLVQAATPAEALAEFNGMWAIALLNMGDGSLLLTRDRAGIKPLYYTLVEGDLYFASEIKTLLVLTGQKFAINRAVVARYIEQSLQDDSNETFFEGIYALPADSYASIDLHQPVAGLNPISYWDAFAANGKWSYANPQQTFRELLMDAVKLRLRSDVPVGLTLSGGLDSSLIAHAMNAQLGHSNFTVLSAVSPGSTEDESRFIDIMAKAYDLDVTKVELGWSADDAMALMQRTTWCNDAPLGSFSNVAFYLLMEQAVQHDVKVILSGQGADELLCGYKKFVAFYVKHLLRQKRFGKALLTLAQFVLNGTVIKQFSFAEAKRYFTKPAAQKSLLSARTRAAYKPAPIAAIGASLAQRQWADYRYFSVPFLTHYEDRMSMAFGREIRLPYLDYRLVEYLLNAPDDLKINRGWTKWLMRDAFKDLLPKEIIWRKDKQGFVNPQAEWLRHQLRPEIERRFADGARIYAHDLIDAAALRARYGDYCSGKTGIWYREIFNPLALEIWLEQFAPYLRDG
jgi:asparagine synthase (glutamine-hydrolysing)